MPPVVRPEMLQETKVTACMLGAYPERDPKSAPLIFQDKFRVDLSRGMTAAAEEEDGE